MIENLLKKSFSETLFQHSVSVANTAKSLSEHWGIDSKIVYYAGLLHDIAKSHSLDTFKQTGILLSDYFVRMYDRYPKIWHAFVGPLLIQKQWVHCLPKSINKRHLYRAIRWHTTGRAKMSVNEKIVFISDYIEPNRAFSDCDFIRELAYKDLDQSLYCILVSTLLSLKRRHLPIHPNTFHCKEYYLDKLYSNDVRMLSAKIDSLNNNREKYQL